LMFTYGEVLVVEAEVTEEVPEAQERRDTM
jgi:hypothetical protein